MFESEQYRKEADNYRRRADEATKPADVAEFRGLERSFDTMADNAQWMAEHAAAIVSGPSHDPESAGSDSLTGERAEAVVRSRTARSREFYRSSNGDRWALIESAGSRLPVVRHTPNEPSGGQPTETDIVSFLQNGNADRPERQEFLRLIAELAFQ